MFNTVTADMTIYLSSKTYNEASDILDELEIPEFSPSDTNSIVVSFDDEYDVDDFLDFFEIIKPILEAFPDDKITMEGKIYNHGNDKYLSFELEGQGDEYKFRNTNWYVDEYVDDDTYEEYEEDYGGDLTEDEFDLYSKKSGKGYRTINSNSGFSKWEYLDM